MGLIDRIFGTSVYSLRKEYDKTREKIDRMPAVEKRLELLRLMDRLEPYITSLEEHVMSNFEKNKTKTYIKRELEKVRSLIEREKRINQSL